MSFTAPTIEKNVEKVQSEFEKKFEIEHELIKKIQFLLSLKVGDSFLASFGIFSSLRSLGYNFNVTLKIGDNPENDKGESRVWRVA